MGQERKKMLITIKELEYTKQVMYAIQGLYFSIHFIQRSGDRRCFRTVYINIIKADHGGLTRVVS